MLKNRSVRSGSVRVSEALPGPAAKACGVVQGGIIPPLVTPLKAPDELDVAGLERLVEHVLAGGVHGLFVLGTSGEAPHLSYRLRRQLIKSTVRLVRGRVPILVGITDTAFTEAIALAGYAADIGADAVVSSAPYYFPVAQPELLNFVRRLTRELPLPLYLYNMPQMTKVEFAPATLQQIIQLERVAGLKDSSGDLSYFRKILTVARERPDWRVFVGPEELLVETLKMGGHGGVNGGAQLFPHLFVDLYAAVQRKDKETVASREQALAQLGRIYTVGPHASAVVQGMKCALSVMGICSDRMALPFSPLNSTGRRQIKAALRGLGPGTACPSRLQRLRKQPAPVFPLLPQ